MSTALQLAGLVTVIVGVTMLSIPVGIILAGSTVTIIGYALGRQQ